jgi:hypothetical protein
MFLVLIIFASAICISLTAAYFSIVGLATMFPGSREAIIIMGAVLEVGKLVAAVWLHKEWRSAFKFIRNYLLIAVFVLSIITSMGIFGFLSRSHVEHSASMEKEQALVAQIEAKISREKDFIIKKQESIKKIESTQSYSDTNKQETISRLQDRVNSIKQEQELSIKQEQDLINKYELRLKDLDKELEGAKSTGLFSDDKKYKSTLLKQEQERQSISANISESEARSNLVRSESLSSINETRKQIDSTNALKIETIKEDPKIELYSLEIDKAYDRVAELENQSFEYGQGLRALETEMGPITYIVEALNDWTGVEIDTGKGIRIVIVTLIFVFDPLAILLLIAATMSYAELQRKRAEGDIPPDVREIRNKLLEEIEEYLQEGGIAEHFIERAKK